MSDPVHLLVTHLVSIVGFAMATLLITSLVAARLAPGTTFAWLLAIVLVPYVGVPAYLVFGTRKLAVRGARKARLYTPAETAAARGTIAGTLCALGAPPPCAGNELVLYTTGESAFAAVLETIESATKTLHISTLILGNDEVGHAVIAALERKARAGVQVRLLLDAMFKRRASRRLVAPVARAGGKVAWFMPVIHVPFRRSRRANLRLHRKIIVADGRAAIIGGMNLASEYMGPTPRADRWRDLSARITGPAVDDLDAVFHADWAFAAGEDIAPPPVITPGETGSMLQVVGSGPDVANDLIYDAFLSAVFAAKTRLWFATPYFVPDEALTRAIMLAARRGVDVRVCVPARSNHLTADLAGASYLRDVASAGGKICCFGPNMLHAKSILVDDSLAVIGSANLDMRSLFLNYEVSVFCTTPSDVATIAAWFEATWPQCGDLRPAGRGRAMVESVMRLIGPLE